MYPHSIRLRGPWEYEPLARVPGEGRPLPPPRRVHTPCPWPDPDFVGRVRLLRRFGYPGTLDSHEHVWLCLPPLPSGSVLHLNGAALEPFAREYDITALLRPRNELRVDLDIGRAQPTWEGAALEVRAAAFLADLEVVRTPTHVGMRGVVCGSIDVMLELYLVADRYPLGYATVAPGGEPRFELLIPARHDDGSEVRNLRLDLVCGAVVWYTYETPTE
jgi:hypothetical protein